MRILVIGSEGTIGTELVKKLSSSTLLDDSMVFRCDRKRIRDERYYMALTNHYQTLEPVFRSVRPDIVLYLAGEVSRETSEHWPSVAVESNVYGTLNVIECCMRYKSALLYTGTSEEYGSCFEDKVYEKDRPTGFRGIYGLTKWMAEELIEYYSRMYKLPAVVLRLFMCYGPGEYPSPFRSAMSIFIDAARRGEDLKVHKDSYRSWCYIDDIVRGIIYGTIYLFNVKNHLDGQTEVFNIGIDQLISTESLAQMIIKMLDSNSKIVLTEAPEGVTLIKDASFQKAKDILGWEALISLEIGLSRTIEWNLENVSL